MKIFFDARLMFYAGVGRFQRETLYELLNLDKNIFTYILGNETKIKRFIKERGLSESNFKIINSDIGKYTFKEQFLLVNTIKNLDKRNAADVFFFPHFNIPFFYIPKKSVVVVHDLTFFHFPQYFGRVKTFFANILLKKVLKKSGKIISVSNYVKNDIILMFGRKSNDSGLSKKLLENKITAVYQGYSKKFKPIKPEDIIKFKQEKGLTDYLLYCGNRKKHKNIINLIKAFEEVKDKDINKNLKLILIGKRFTENGKPDFIDDYISKNRVADVISLENVTDYELNMYYSSCSAFVFISLSEGFGLAPIEALASGAPHLILAGNSALPEIFKNAAIYVNPLDIKDISQAVAKTLLPSSNRNKTTEEKLERDNLLNYYSYSKCAQNIHDIFLRMN